MPEGTMYGLDDIFEALIASEVAVSVVDALEVIYITYITVQRRRLPFVIDSRTYRISPFFPGLDDTCQLGPGQD
jgi:hypothetical protein